MNENAKKWVEALRSGEFEQARQALRDGDGYCCLGVACEVYKRETGEGYWTGDSFLDTTHTLPNVVQDWLGLRTEVGAYRVTTSDELGYNREKNLADDHNDLGASFADIAGVIESEPEGLFA